MESNDRHLNGDVLKGLAIYGVVFIHTCSVWVEPNNVALFFSNIFRFAVPTFIIIWAYYLEKSVMKRESEILIYLKKKFVHLFRIYLVWSVLYLIISANWPKLTVVKILTKHFLGYGWSGQYYFLILFQMIILYPLLRILFEKKYGIMITLFTVFGLYAIMEFNLSGYQILELLGDRFFLFWIIYVAIGFFLTKQSVKTLNGALIATVVIIPMEFYYLDVIKIKHSPYITFGVLIASTLSTVTLMKLNLSKLNKHFLNLFSALGKNTMLIFVANPLIIMIMKNVYIEVHNEWQYIIPFILTFFVIFCCLILERLMIIFRVNTIFL